MYLFLYTYIYIYVLPPPHVPTFCGCLFSQSRNLKRHDISSSLVERVATCIPIHIYIYMHLQHMYAFI